MSRKQSQATKEQILLNDMRKELKRICLGHDKLLSLQKECVDLKAKLDNDLEQVLVQYLGFKKGDSMPLTDILIRVADLK